VLELYHWEPVSHSLRALICLEEAGADYSSHYVDLLAFEQFGDDFLALNRNGQVPVLVANGMAMSESALITEYLAESFPAAALAPADPLGWYRVQTWTKYIDYNLGSSLATLGCSRFLAPLLAGRGEELTETIEAIPLPERRAGWLLAAGGRYPETLIENSGRKVALVVERMETLLVDADWLVGDRYSIADINTFAMIHGLRDVAEEFAGAGAAPHTDAWYRRIVARPAVARALAKGVRYEPGTVYAPGPEHSRWG